VALLRVDVLSATVAPTSAAAAPSAAAGAAKPSSATGAAGNAPLSPAAVTVAAAASALLPGRHTTAVAIALTLLLYFRLPLLACAGRVRGMPATMARVAALLAEASVADEREALVPSPKRRSSGPSLVGPDSGWSGPDSGWSGVGLGWVRSGHEWVWNGGHGPLAIGAVRARVRKALGLGVATPAAAQGWEDFDELDWSGACEKGGAAHAAAVRAGGQGQGGSWGPTGVDNTWGEIQSCGAGGIEFGPR